MQDKGPNQLLFLSEVQTHSEEHTPQTPYPSFLNMPG